MLVFMVLVLEDIVSPALLSPCPIADLSPSHLGPGGLKSPLLDAQGQGVEQKCRCAALGIQKAVASIGCMTRLCLRKPTRLLPPHIGLCPLLCF